jgi:uncharacterized membrane-anchored protein YitT (DUF2179 family)
MSWRIAMWFAKKSLTMSRTIITILKQASLIALGSLLFAFAVKALLAPHGLLAGGLTGYSLLIYCRWNTLPLGLIYFLINVPIFLLGWRFVGRRFIAYSLFGLVIFSSALSMIHLRVDVSNPLLATLTAAALTGTGTAIILRSYGSTGGGDVFCVVLHKLFSVTLGTGSLILNALLLAWSAFVFPAEKVLYAAVYIFVAAQFTDKLFKSMTGRRSAVIISEKWKAILEALTAERIGITAFHGHGGFNGQELTLLYSITSTNRIPRLKRLVGEADKDAFIAVMAAEDVTGVEVGNQPHW